MATLLKRQKPMARLLSAWWPGGRIKAKTLSTVAGHNLIHGRQNPARRQSGGFIRLGAGVRIRIEHGIVPVRRGGDELDVAGHVDQLQLLPGGQAGLNLDEFPLHPGFLQHLMDDFQAMMRFRMIRVGLMIQIANISDDSGSLPSTLLLAESLEGTRVRRPKNGKAVPIPGPGFPAPVPASGSLLL